LLERVAVVEGAAHPDEVFAVRLFAAGEGLHLVPGGERGVDQVRADEAGAAGDGELHSGDQGRAEPASSRSCICATPSAWTTWSSSGSTPSPSGAETGRGVDPLARSIAAATFF